eukprot:Transcript_6825.p2 GENE.Transcript_6825~~Transcript_6825.p2  ORF type:complete len:342 (-),score=21.11 Transcript_6825:419-1444(-)
MQRAERGHAESGEGACSERRGGMQRAERGQVGSGGAQAGARVEQRIAAALVEATHVVSEEADGKGTGRDVLGHRGPGHDGDVRQRREDLAADALGVAAVEQHAAQPRQRGARRAEAAGLARLLSVHARRKAEPPLLRLALHPAERAVRHLERRRLLLVQVCSPGAAREAPRSEEARTGTRGFGQGGAASIPTGEHTARGPRVRDVSGRVARPEPRGEHASGSHGDRQRARQHRPLPDPGFETRRGSRPSSTLAASGGSASGLQSDVRSQMKSSGCLAAATSNLPSGVSSAKFSPRSPTVWPLKSRMRGRCCTRARRAVYSETAGSTASPPRGSVRSKNLRS